MNALSPALGELPAGISPDADAPAWRDTGRTLRLLRRLVLLHGAAILAVAGTAAFRGHPLVAAAWRDGLAGTVLSSLILPLTGLLATVPLCQIRHRLAEPEAAAPGAARLRFRLLDGFRRRAGVDGRGRRFTAPPVVRWSQGLVVPLGAACAAFAPWASPWISPWLGSWFAGGSGAAALVPLSAGLACAAAITVGAFAFLLAERVLAAVEPARLPEAAALRDLLLLPVVCAPVAGLAFALSASGQAWGRAGTVGVALFLSVVAAELGLRALGGWFLPCPSPAAARAAVSSAGVLLLQPRRLAAIGVAAPLRTHLGLDFSRSWALRFVRAALPSVLLLLGAVAWGLSGVALVGLDRRAVYERLGEPAAIWQPGLHVGLPWPLARVRIVELGTIHATSLGNAEAAAAAPPAEAETVPGADRLWDAVHPAEVSFLIAAADAGGAQGFGTVNLDLTVLWRTGLSDTAARQAAYAVATPEALVKAEAGQLLNRFFAGQTLSAVLGGDRERVSDELRAALQRDLDRLQSGIEVVAVVTEAVHPPAAAADAFHAVQAAEIAARAAVFVERGRALATAAGALQFAADARDKASAAAADTVGAARVLQEGFDADRAAATSGPSFLLDRHLSALSTALARAPLVILDHRLGGAAAPVIDLRPVGAPKPSGDDD
ncbi:MAG: SPFH domain-containing protein [Janthinobacterium lividum]